TETITTATYTLSLHDALPIWERWDKALIQRGHQYLINATAGNEISAYHLEAGIAYWHTVASDANKWRHILQLYNQLILIEYSPRSEEHTSELQSRETLVCRLL